MSKSEDRTEIPDRFSAGVSQCWFNAKERGKSDPNGSEVAQALHRVANERETAMMPTRWHNYVFARLMSGRQTIAQFAYAMAKRPETFINFYRQFEFGAQKSGLSALLGDVYTNRLLSHRTYVDLVPDQGNLYKQRKQSQELARWTDAAFTETRYWECYKRAGLDAIWFGSGVIGFEESGDENEKISPEVVHMDELLWGNLEIPFNDQKEVIRRRYVDRYELWAKYQDDPEAAAAILNAPGAHQCFFFGPGKLNTDQVIPLVIGYKLGSLDGGKGRHTVAVADFALIDEEFEPDTLPFEAFHFFEISGSTWGQGLAEVTLQYSEWLDELLSVTHESDIRAGRGKWFVDETSNVNTDDLSDAVANVVTFLGNRPVYEAHESISPSVMQRAQSLIEMAMSRVHVSGQAIKGEVPKSLTSAVALEKWAAIDDSNFLEMIGRVEEFVRRCALQYIRIAKRIKPKYTLTGRTKQLIDWPELEMDADHPLNITAYCIGRLGQTLAGKTQKLQQLRQQGDITRQQYLRYLETPNTEGLLDTLNARTDLVDMVLDELVFGKDYVPPPAFCDFEYALSATEDRYSIEAQQETPQRILDRLLQFRAHLKELQAQGVPATAPAPGLVPPDASAPAGGPPLGDFGSGLPTEAMNPAPTPTGLPAPPIPIPPPA